MLFPVQKGTEVILSENGGNVNFIWEFRREDGLRRFCGCRIPNCTWQLSKSTAVDLILRRFAGAVFLDEIVWKWADACKTRHRENTEMILVENLKRGTADLKAQDITCYKNSTAFLHTGRMGCGVFLWRKWGGCGKNFVVGVCSQHIVFPFRLDYTLAVEEISARKYFRL